MFNVYQGAAGLCLPTADEGELTKSRQPAAFVPGRHHEADEAPSSDSGQGILENLSPNQK